MDKTKQVRIFSKKRQGFALMITLSVLAVVIALSTVLLGYYKEAQNESSSTKALIQANVYYADMVTIFNSIQDKKTLFPFLYSAPLPLQDTKEKFSMVLECKAINRGANINWLGLSENTEAQTQYKFALKLFDFIAQEYELRDPARLIEILQEEMSIGYNLVTVLPRRLHQKKGIISYEQFETLLLRYQFESDDANVGLVPWKKYFSFLPQANKIDAAYSSPELIAFLFEIDASAVSEWASSFELGKPSLKEFVEQNGGDYAKWQTLLADAEFMDETECSVLYQYAKEQYRFKFEYIRGEAKHFEFYGQQ